MKKMKKIVAFMLLVCITLTLVPPIQITRAAETVMRYELDTDGIDVGATYLVVNSGTAGAGNALRFYYGSSWSRDFRNQALTIKKENGDTFIETGFENEADCQFTFTGSTAGRLNHGEYGVDMANSRFTTGSGNTLAFANLGGGQYRITYTDSGWWSETVYYLQYYNSDWRSSTTASSVYLYKLSEHVVSYDVTFNGNGHTSGTLPQDATNVSSGTEYVVPAPPTELRKDDNDENTWLFGCWNTKPDGSGTEYAPGETITITEDVTLYVDWVQQTKYSVSMLTYLDEDPTDVEVMAGYDKQFFALLEGGDGTYIPLKKRSAGVYSAKVVDNGTYVIYTQNTDGEYEPVHGHTVVIYGQDGTTECMHYSVVYNTNGGSWADGEERKNPIYHYGDTVTAWNDVPTLEGNRFLGWKDQHGNLYAPGQRITESVGETIMLTAQWEELITVTVDVVIDHNAENGGDDRDLGNMHKVSFTLLREENGVNLPIEEKILESGYVYDPVTNITTYRVVFENMPQGVYHIMSVKTNYDGSMVYEGSAGENQTITLKQKYVPDNFDLNFNVVVNAENDVEKKLMPKAVNVKVSYWGYDDSGVLGWHIITQQAGDNVPTTVTIGEDGTGTGYFPVWRYWSGGTQPYEYRIEITAFILPDGSIVPATSNDKIKYTIDNTGLYEAVISVEEGGRKPTYPDGSDTELSGAYFTGETQNGIPTVTLDITPYTVKFDAGEGTVNGQKTVILEGQLRYPALYEYVAVPNSDDRRFICWMIDGEPAVDMAGQLLSGNVTYTARYNENITLSGSVSADASYQQDGETVYIHDIDRAENVWVVLQKKVGNTYNDIASVPVELTYKKNDEGKYTYGTGSYEFTDLPNDGTEYRVYLLVRNYTGIYDNDQDDVYAEKEAVALIDELSAEAQVDIHLNFDPDNYQQAIKVDASQIHSDLRPTGVLAQIIYRDLGDVHNYQVISQHTVDPFGVMVELDPSKATGLGFYDVWNWHTNGSPYEYQTQISKVYGKNVPGAYSEEGLAYTENSPFTIVYGPANNYLKQMLEGGVMLEAKLVPKEYPVYLDLNLGNDKTTPVLGLEDFIVDNDSGEDTYMFMHTWSYAEQFTAYPYREGYVFKGWTSSNTDDVYIQDGVIYVGNTLANEVTLTAQWEKLTGTDCTVVYLELNTDKVLRGSSLITGTTAGSNIMAADMVVAIEGYVYAGAYVNGRYIDKADNPYLTVTQDPVKNLMIVYYLPDGSDGYTEQVESNLEINKTAVLEDNGTYTITLDTYTKDNPITTLIQQNTPLDIVLVLDQSGSLAENDFEYLTALQGAVRNFVESVADHGRRNEVDHRIAMVGYAGNASDGHSSDPVKATGGKQSDSWINTGVFDSNGEYHLYNVNGFNYTMLSNTDSMTADGIYYTKVTSDGVSKYLLLTHHNEYRHLIDEEGARVAVLQGETVYGYVYNEQGVGSFVELTRNSSGLWLYGNKQLYSESEFFTYHTDVWTHRDGLNPRQIHAYGVGAAYTPVDGHDNVYTRDETTGSSYEQSIYVDALVPVSVGAAGSGGTNPGLLNAIEAFGADGATRASYGMEMANEVLKATPKDDGDGRLRLVVMFTDGEPGYMGFDSSSGQQYYEQAVTEANNAIAQAYISKNTYGAYVYSIGLYESAGVEATSEVAYYMNALSSNYPNAKTMDDIKTSVKYETAQNGTALESNGKFYVRHNNSGSTYYEVKYGYVRVSSRNQYCWYYTRNNTNYSITTTVSPTVSNGKVGTFTIYKKTGGYAETPNSGYYATTESADHLKGYFEDVLRDITTKITTEIILESDTILRDIMNQGLVMTDGTVITVYTQEGIFNLDTNTIDWAVDENKNPILEQKVSLTIGSGQTQIKDATSGVEIITYNVGAENVTDPTKENYSPHTVDITGYDFYNWYISETHTKGYKMVVTITRVEATDGVEWGKSTATNHERSGLWLPADKQGNRELLLPFNQPTTIFVERAYVLDYGKEFTLSNWYFDDEVSSDGTVVKEANPVHVDCNIENGMNWFDPENPNVQNSVSGSYGNTKYGNVQVVEQADGSNIVTYKPTTTNWGGYDQFYVFGDTWRKTVLAQDANENHNLWNKVTVIPANNIYYEDSFVTTDDTTQNGIEGFTFTGSWTVVGKDSGNTEVPEQLESSPYGDVHGWTDSLGDDMTYSDGSAHGTGLDGKMGAKAEFTFTGTGVEVYTRTNAKSGMVVAVLKRITKGENGQQNVTVYKSLSMDNLAVSGDYYHIPTVAFKELPYGTYSLQLIATAANAVVEGMRYEYYIDGVRIHNPLGNTTNYATDIIKDAYGLETNAVFTEVRDILLDYGDFNADMPDSDDGKLGAVFIDLIQDGQGSGNDSVGDGVPSYEIGTFENYGPKNEVYLSAGQSIVLKVAEGNNYYIGLKSLTGAEVTANVSGIDKSIPKSIKLSHTVDMYYQVTPVNGYIVIQNGNNDGALLSITNLRTTNLTTVAPNGGILPVTKQEALLNVSGFTAYMMNKPEEEESAPLPEEQLPSAEEQIQANQQQAEVLFTAVRQWLENN